MSKGLPLIEKAIYDISMFYNKEIIINRSDIKRKSFSSFSQLCLMNNQVINNMIQNRVMVQIRSDIDFYSQLILYSNSEVVQNIMGPISKYLIDILLVILIQVQYIRDSRMCSVELSKSRRQLVQQPAILTLWLMDFDTNISFYLLFISSSVIYLANSVENERAIEKYCFVKVYVFVGHRGMPLYVSKYYCLPNVREIPIIDAYIRMAQKIPFYQALHF